MNGFKNVTESINNTCTVAKIETVKGFNEIWAVQYQLCTGIFNLTRAFYVLLMLRESDCRIKSLEKYVNTNLSPRFLVHIIFKILM